MAISINRPEFEAKVVAKSWKNPIFRGRLKKNADTVYIVVPPDPAAGSGGLPW